LKSLIRKGIFSSFTVIVSLVSKKNDTGLVFHQPPLDVGIGRRGKEGLVWMDQKKELNS
jgi:hypothetical protein